jgi:hypothetical protein
MAGSVDRLVRGMARLLEPSICSLEPRRRRPVPPGWPRPFGARHDGLGWAIRVRAKVREALDDPRPDIPNEQVEARFAARRAEPRAGWPPAILKLRWRRPPRPIVSPSATTSKPAIRGRPDASTGGSRPAFRRCCSGRMPLRCSPIRALSPSFLEHGCPVQTNATKACLTSVSAQFNCHPRARPEDPGAFKSRSRWPLDCRVKPGNDNKS